MLAAVISKPASSSKSRADAALASAAIHAAMTSGVSTRI
jgi:hypothetical protein